MFMISKQVNIHNYSYTESHVYGFVLYISLYFYNKVHQPFKSQ